jgi:hypothetical protein
MSISRDAHRSQCGGMEHERICDYCANGKNEIREYIRVRPLPLIPETNHVSDYNHYKYRNTCKDDALAGSRSSNAGAGVAWEAAGHSAGAAAQYANCRGIPAANRKTPAWQRKIPVPSGWYRDFHTACRRILKRLVAVDILDLALIRSRGGRD